MFVDVKQNFFIFPAISSAILFGFPTVLEKMAAILFKTEHHWKTECHWKSEQMATIVILHSFNIPAPTVDYEVLDGYA